MTSTSARPSGGWLDAITKGTAVAYTDDRTDDEPQRLRITTRVAEVLRELYGGGGRDYRTAADVARAIGRPPGNIQPLLMRLETNGWAESRMTDVARAWRLTDTGIEGCHEQFPDDESDDYVPPARRSPIAADRAADREFSSRSPRRTADHAPSTFTSLADLERTDPALAAAARRAIAAGRYTDS